MGKSYELTYSNKATINVGNYENENPMFAEKKIITVEDGIEIDLEGEFEEMRFLIDNQLRKAVSSIRNKEKQKALDGMRIKIVDGISYPSVTTIITPEKPEIPNLDLYALRGNMWDRVFQRMVEKAEYVTNFTPVELMQIDVIGGMKGHSLRWAFDNNDLDFRSGHTEVINKTTVYYGTYDADGFYKKEPAIFDCKSGKMSKPMIEKAFMQIAAYCKAKEDEATERGVQHLADFIATKRPKYMVIIPTQQAEPIVSEEIEKYYEKFLGLRKTFRDTYGV